VKLSPKRGVDSGCAVLCCGWRQVRRNFGAMRLSLAAAFIFMGFCHIGKGCGKIYWVLSKWRTGGVIVYILRDVEVFLGFCG